VEAAANALKAYATRHTTDTLQEVREACGGQGYLHENRISTLMADTDVFTTFEGDNTVLLLQVAKGLLSDFQREFRDLNLLGMVRFVASDIVERFSETNPLTSGQTDPEHLRGAEFQQNALDYRAGRLLQTAAQRLKARLDDDIRPFDAFIEVQDHLVSLARAHAERLVLRAFIEQIETVEDDSVVAVLSRLRSLFALHAIEADRGWFLESGLLSASKSKAIRHQVNALCEEIRPDAEALVNAFAIPDACLAAPIGTGQRA
jgi:acyl-CoA oxidase